MQSVAYIRRSHEDVNGHVSKDTQQASVLALAERDGVAIGELLTDWGKSGGDEALKYRPAFRRLLAMVERGEVSTVYAYKLDRLGRGQTALGKLWAAAEATRTRIVTQEEGDLSDMSDPAKWLLRHTLAGFAEFYYREQKRKSEATLAYCRKRGDDFGQAPLGYEKRTPKDGCERVEFVKVDPDAIARVVAAYERAGTFLGAAKALNDAGAPTPRPTWGKQLDKWHPRTIKNIVQREAGHLIPETVRRGTRGPARPRLFAGLLRCYCGGTLTPGGGEANRSLSYYCARGQRDPGHGRPYTVSEKKLMVWIKAEAARLRSPYDVVESDGPEYDDSDDRARLDAARDLIGEAAYLEAIERLRAVQDAHGERQAIRQAIPERIEWETWSTEAINATLRALWHHVELGPDLLPVRADWTVPEWRASGGAS